MADIEWGEYISVDMGECDPIKLRDREYIIKFIESLVTEIGMKRYGEVQAVRFALHDPKVAGYSAMCFLETSHISCHFAEASNSIYLDIFTCSQIDVEKTLKFCTNYFNARYLKYNFKSRVIPDSSNSFEIPLWNPGKYLTNTP